MKIYNIFQKNPETFTESGSYDVAGNPADLRQMITLLQVPLLLLQRALPLLRVLPQRELQLREPQLLQVCRLLLPSSQLQP